MRNLHSLQVITAVAAALALSACGGSSGTTGGTTSVTPAGQGVEVRVAPSSAAMAAGETLAFTALVTGTSNTLVTWSVQETGGGSVSQGGLYTAPAAAGTYHVVATSVASSSARAVAEVVVSAAAPGPNPPAVQVTVSPGEATVDACKGTVLTAQVANATDARVNWTVQESGGGVVVNGIYTAPSTAGTYHVVATSVTDGAARGTATITVGPQRVLAVAVTPGQASLASGGALAFAATVTTTCGSFAAQ